MNCSTNVPAQLVVCCWAVLPSGDRREIEHLLLVLSWDLIRSFRHRSSPYFCLGALIYYKMKTRSVICCFKKGSRLWEAVWPSLHLQLWNLLNLESEWKLWEKNNKESGKVAETKKGFWRYIRSRNIKDKNGVETEQQALLELFPLQSGYISI